MNIFISWSGDSSREIANFLHGWLPSVLQSIKPYMSTENIEKGERWGQNIANELQDAQYGVVRYAGQSKRPMAPIRERRTVKEHWTIKGFSNNLWSSRVGFNQKPPLAISVYTVQSRRYAKTSNIYQQCGT
jgi:hypothetical protein